MNDHEADHMAVRKIDPGYKTSPNRHDRLYQHIKKFHQLDLALKILKGELRTLRIWLFSTHSKWHFHGRPDSFS